MAVRKEKKCFSLFYTKTQLSDYVIHILDALWAVRESEKHVLECSSNLSAYANNPNELTIQETVFALIFYFFLSLNLFFVGFLH